jgi:hypothetical protein
MTEELISIPIYVRFGGGEEHLIGSVEFAPGASVSDVDEATSGLLYHFAEEYTKVSAELRSEGGRDDD